MVVPMESLRNIIKESFKHVKGLYANMVISPSEALKQHYDILLVDEAHRLKRRVGLFNYASFDKNNKMFGHTEDSTELDWMFSRSKHRILFYDAEQSIKPTDVLKRDFDKLFPGSLKIELKSQLRVRGGEKYMDFVNRLLTDQPVAPVITDEEANYDIFLFESFKEMRDKLKEQESKFGLCRLLAGFAWEWKSREGKSDTDFEIEGIRLKWNSDVSRWINSPKAADEVGSIHKTQGCDINYAGIIFGNDISYDDKKKEIIVRPENYHDKKERSRSLLRES